jgi:uncharacterized protein (DUF2267 family)
MKYDELLAKVRERGEYADRKETEQVTVLVFEVFRTRITQGAAEHLAAQLPPPLDEVLRARGAGPTESFGADEFCRRVAEVTDATPRTAVWDVSAVLTTVADAVSAGELNKIISQLPSGYAELFGRPGLSG